MALKKKMVDEKGISIEYFRIANTQQNFINSEPYFEVYMYGYANEEFRLTEKDLEDPDTQTVVWFDRFYLPLDDTKGYSRADIYERLKLEVELFEGAEDC